MALPNPVAGIIQGGVLAPGLIPVATSLDTSKPTYRAALNANTFQGGANVLLEIGGSATKTVRVHEIGLWIQAGTKFVTEILAQRVAVFSAGTPNAANMYPLDPSDVAATAVVNYYTAAAAQSATPKILDYLALNTVVGSGTIVTPGASYFSYGKRLVLRGAADILQIYSTISGFAAGTYGFVIEWEEDNS